MRIQTNSIHRATGRKVSAAEPDVFVLDELIV